jgi:hypothetical protein
MGYHTHSFFQRICFVVAVLLILGADCREVPIGSVDSILLNSRQTDTASTGHSQPMEIDLSSQRAVTESLRETNLAFEANNGQTDEQVRFLSRGNGYTLFLTDKEVVLKLHRNATKPSRQTLSRQSAMFAESTPAYEVIRLRSIGMHPDSKIRGLDQLSGKSNYFIGNDPKKWHRDVANYGKVQIDEVYPGIDLVYYGTRNQVEFDWIVAAGADPGAIRFSVECNNALEIDSKGNLILDHRGELRLKKPVVYQHKGGTRLQIAAGYVLLDKHLVGIAIGGYDASLPLVIDPVLSYSTYLGGTRGDAGAGIAIDSSGNAYVTGSADSTNFPTKDPLQTKTGGIRDVFISKLNAAGDAMVYSTYLGGSSGEGGSGITIDSSGNVYVTGYTWSADYPTVNPFQANYGGNQSGDAFVTKVNASGNALVYSTYLGDEGQEFGNGIAVDASGNAYITGQTYSTKFAVMNPFQDTLGGTADAFIAKLDSSGSALVYSTYLGSDGTESGMGIVVDSSGNAYVTGATQASGFPTANALQTDYGGGTSDAFIAKLNAAGDAMVYSTYLGGTDSDQGSAIAIDANGNAYITGITSSTDFPTQKPFQPDFGGGGTNAFISKLSASGKVLVYSTYFGINSGGFGIAVDASGRAFVTGATYTSAFPTLNPLQEIYGGGNSDAFVAGLDAQGNALTYSTYLGGSAGDSGMAITVDSSGNAYVTGSTSSDDFPTAQPIQTSYRGNSDGFVAKIAFSSAHSLDLMLGDGGATAVSTSGSDNTVEIGYAVMDVNSGTKPYGTAVFSFKQGIQSEPDFSKSASAHQEVTVCEAGVPASTPTTSARVFIDYGTGIIAVPGRAESGNVDIYTGIAVVNPGDTLANVTYTLHDISGTTITVGNGTVAAGAHFAKFIDQFKNEIAPDFNLPADFQTNTRFGSLEIASDQPLAVLALRMTINQRGEALLTTTPTADLTMPLNSDDAYFPQFVDGGGYTTSIVLLNTSSSLETGSFAILDDNGDPLLVNQVGGTADSSFNYSIPPGGVYRFQTDGSPVSAKIGWVRLTPDAGTSTPVGSGVFGYNPGSILVTESGIPAALATTHARIFVDLSATYNTGLAIANVVDAAANITINAFQTDGTTAVGTSQGPLQLSAYGHDAKFADQFISGLPDGFTGVLDISASTQFAALTLRALVNERQDFLMTTFPIADANRTAPSPIVFPQIADGGGYVTQFILISPSGGASATLYFYGEDGTPWPLMR